MTAGTYNNYNWSYTPTTSPVGFTLTSAPATGNNATRFFYVDQGGAIHYNDGAAATATSPVLGN
jgi:hypothetical protein